MEVRGTALQASRAYILDRYGPARFEDVCRQAPEAVRSLFARRIPPYRWYAFELLIGWMRTAQRVLAPHDDRFFWEMGRHAADFALNRFYRYLLALASPQRVVHRAPTVWSHYYRPGRMVVEEVAPTHGCVRLEDFPHGEPAFCERLMGWMERTVELTGGLNCQFHHPRCQTRGDPVCEFVGAWIL